MFYIEHLSYGRNDYENRRWLFALRKGETQKRKKARDDRQIFRDVWIVHCKCCDLPFTIWCRGKWWNSTTCHLHRIVILWIVVLSYILTSQEIIFLCNRRVYWDMLERIFIPFGSRLIIWVRGITFWNAPFLLWEKNLWIKKKLKQKHLQKRNLCERLKILIRTRFLIWCRFQELT